MAAIVATCPNVLLDCHRLGEVPGLVDVAPPEDGHVVAEQLHGDDGEHGLEGVHRLGHLHKMKSLDFSCMYSLL